MMRVVINKTQTYCWRTDPGPGSRLRVLCVLCAVWKGGDSLKRLRMFRATVLTGTGLLCLDSPGPGETGVGVGVGGVGPLAYPPCQYFPVLFSLCSPPAVVSLVVWCRTARSGDSRGGSLSQVETVSQGGLDQPLQPHQHSDGH